MVRLVSHIAHFVFIIGVQILGGICVCNTSIFVCSVNKTLILRYDFQSSSNTLDLTS